MALHRRAAKRDKNEPTIVSALEALGCVVWRVSGKGLPDLIVLRAGKKWLADVKGPKEKPTPAQEKAWEEAATKARCAVFILRTPEDAAAMLNNALQPWEPMPTAVREDMDAFKRAIGVKSLRSTANAPRPNGAAGISLPPRKGDAAKERENGRKRLSELRGQERIEEVSRRLKTGEPVYGDVLIKESTDYTPPRSKPVDAAKPVRGLGSEMMAEMLKPPGEENYEKALGRALAAAKEAEATFAPPDLDTRECGCIGRKHRLACLSQIVD